MTTCAAHMHTPLNGTVPYYGNHMRQLRCTVRTCAQLAKRCGILWAWQHMNITAQHCGRHKTAQLAAPTTRLTVTLHSTPFLQTHTRGACMPCSAKQDNTLPCDAKQEPKQIVMQCALLLPTATEQLFITSDSMACGHSASYCYK